MPGGTVRSCPCAIEETGAQTWSENETASSRRISALGFEIFRWNGKLAAMTTNAPMPTPFRDKFLRKESPLGKPVGDYNEHILRCAVMNQAVEGYNCTESEIAAARRVIRDAVR